MSRSNTQTIYGLLLQKKTIYGLFSIYLQILYHLVCNL